MNQFPRTPGQGLPPLVNTVCEPREPVYSDNLSPSAKTIEAFALHFNPRHACARNKQENQLGWYDVTKDELRAYLGILVIMSIHSSPPILVLEYRQAFQCPRNLKCHDLQEVSNHIELAAHQ